MNRHAIFGFCILTVLILSSVFSLFPNPDINQVQEQEQTERIIPICNRDYFYHMHAELQNASSSIHIVQFQMRYYPSYPSSHSNIFLNDLIEAKERGVDVKVMLEGGEDFLGENFTEDQIKAQEYLEAGDVEVKFDGKGITTHAKLIVIDKRVVILGSTNWNYYALDRNNEASVLIKSNEIGEYYDDYFHKLWNQWEIKVNEFMPDPSGYDDAEMPNGEWVELYNLGEEDVNVSGWVLYDLYDYHELYIAPSNTNTGNTIVTPNGFLVVYRNGDDDFCLNNNNNGYEEVRLYDGYPARESTPIDKVSYSSSERNKSWARIPDGTGNFSITKPTPGMKNVANTHKHNEIFDTTGGTYPSLPGTHEGMLKLNQTITVSKLYTYPCPGTGGHSEYARIWNNSGWNVTANWGGYRDWHNITFDDSFKLAEGKTYNYTIKTGSYPQIIHKSSKEVTVGVINCTEFTDTNGKRYNSWIPAIKFFQ